MRVELEAAYILHTRAYRESSLLVYALTAEHGVVHLISRAAKKKNGNMIQPLTKCYLTWSGKGSLLSLNKVELEYSKYTRNFRSHVQCLYIHELLLRLVPERSPAPELFDLYEQTLEKMLKLPTDEGCLRAFELELLAIIGHPLQLDFDYQNNLAVEAEQYYRYVPDAGPVLSAGLNQTWDSVTGRALLDMAAGDFRAENLPAMKRFLRGLLEFYLRGKPVLTRQLLKVN